MEGVFQRNIRPRWRRRDLGYCSNVHPGEGLAQVEAMLHDSVRAVAAARGLESMAAGLWLSHAAVEALADAGARERFRAKLDADGVRLITLNAFPYGDFHAERVKESVFLPDWSDERRLRYTLACAEVLAACLPDDAAEGTLSTLPLGLRAAWSGEKENVAAGLLLTAVERLDALAAATGKPIRLCLEPEPGAVLERAEQAIAFFDWLHAAARAAGVSPERVQRHLGVCYDVCHQAVMFEDTAADLARLADAGVAIGKIQLSCALEARPGAHAGLAAYAEPRYLHQVRVSDGQTLLGAPDLPAALADPTLPVDRPWRVHFHVPLHSETFATAGVTGTRAELLRVFDTLAARPALTPQLEVETYTWSVLPAPLRPADPAALIGGIRAELEWVERELGRRGLLVS